MLKQDSTRRKASAAGKISFVIQPFVLFWTVLLCACNWLVLLLLKVIFTWMEGRNGADMLGKCHLDSTDGISQSSDSITCPCELSKTGKRKYLEPGSNVSETDGTHPMNEILLWHNAIKRELNEIAEEARKIQFSGDFSNLWVFNERLQFIAEVCFFHRYFYFVVLYFFFFFSLLINSTLIIYRI